jgi:hypothetical protein
MSTLAMWSAYPFFKNINLCNHCKFNVFRHRKITVKNTILGPKMAKMKKIANLVLRGI